MKDPFELADRAIQNRLGKVVTVTGNSGTYALKGVFTSEHEIIDSDTGIVTTQPHIQLIAGDVPEKVKSGFVISIDAVDYKIEEVRREDSGGLSCLLKKQRS